MSALVILVIAWLGLRMIGGLASRRGRVSPARELYERRLRDAGRR